MAYDMLHKSALFSAQSRPSLVAYSLLGYGSQNIELLHYQYHIVNQDALRKVFCDELEEQHDILCRFLLHTFGRYNYPFQEHFLRRLNIPGFGSLFGALVLSRLSIWGACYQSKYAGVEEALTQALKRFPFSFVLWLLTAFYPCWRWQFFALFRQTFFCLNNSYCLSSLVRFLLLLLVAKQGYLLSYAVLARVSSYCNYNTRGRFKSYGISIRAI